jgi:phenylpyruvate tautomerase PptA (4-oxalocrotonate tautomerase family)
MKGPAMPIIRIEMSAGQTYETKTAVARDVTKVVSENTGYDPDKILIFFYDTPRWEQAKAGVMRDTPPKSLI